MLLVPETGGPSPVSRDSWSIREVIFIISAVTDVIFTISAVRQIIFITIMCLGRNFAQDFIKSSAEII